MEVSGQHHAPAALYPRGRAPGTHWAGDWVGPTAALDAGARRKILCFCGGSNPGGPPRSQTIYCLSYRGSTYGVYIFQFLNFSPEDGHYGRIFKRSYFCRVIPTAPVTMFTAYIYLYNLYNFNLF
jgi:hypothetical protein